MRCFVAVDVPEDIKEELLKIQTELKGTAKIKFVNHFHITLKFLGEISENEINEIKERLRKIKFKPFNLELTKVGVFPNENYMRVIWIGVKGRIKELQQKVDAELLDKFSKDERFSEHITLGRVKFIKHKEELKKKLGLNVKGEFLVKDFKLYKSELRKEGPKYSIIDIFPL